MSTNNININKYNTCSGQHNICSGQRNICSGKRNICSGQRNICSGQHNICIGQHRTPAVGNIITASVQYHSFPILPNIGIMLPTKGVLYFLL